MLYFLQLYSFRPELQILEQSVDISILEIEL